MGWRKVLVKVEGWRNWSDLGSEDGNARELRWGVKEERWKLLELVEVEGEKVNPKSNWKFPSSSSYKACRRLRWCR